MLLFFTYNNRKDDSSGDEDDGAESKKLRGQLNSKSTPFNYEFTSFLTYSLFWIIISCLDVVWVKFDLRFVS